MKRLISILGLIVLATILIGSMAHAGEQARVEKEKLACPIN